MFFFELNKIKYNFTNVIKEIEIVLVGLSLGVIFVYYIFIVYRYN